MYCQCIPRKHVCRQILFIIYQTIDSFKQSVVHVCGKLFFGEKDISFRLMRYVFSCCRVKTNHSVSLCLCRPVDGERLRRQLNRYSVRGFAYANAHMCFCIYAYSDAHVHTESHTELSWKVLSNLRLPHSSPHIRLLLFLPHTTLNYF